MSSVRCPRRRGNQLFRPCAICGRFGLASLAPPRLARRDAGAWLECSNWYSRATESGSGESHNSSPPTPPDMRVRIRRFGGINDCPPVELGIPSELKKALDSANARAGFTRGHGNCPSFARQALAPHPAGEVRQTGPGSGATASSAQTEAGAWSTPRDRATPMALDTARNSPAKPADSGITPRPCVRCSTLGSGPSVPGLVP